MAERCGEQHPEDRTRLCDLPPGPHGDHLDFAHSTDPWPNVEVQRRVAIKKANGSGRRAKRRSDMAQLAATIVVAKREGIPAEARQKWEQEPWLAYATEVFMGFLRGREEPFTTAEHVWPLLECPEEMRAMSVVTQRMLRGGVIREQGATRLRGTYRTKDGVEFRENKLVPVYRSLI